MAGNDEKQDCSGCNKRCASHETNTDKINRNEKELEELDKTVCSSNSRLSALEGKFGTFTWICGSLLTVLIGLSVYAILQLQSFKEQYHQDREQYYRELLDTNHSSKGAR